MRASVEISMYPLDKNYKEPILDFIGRLRQYEELSVQVNNMSTQVFGAYDEVMDALRHEMKKSMQDNPTVVLVLKVINADLEG